MKKKKTNEQNYRVCGLFHVYVEFKEVRQDKAELPDWSLVLQQLTD